jgi:hypothetical protein
MCALRFTASIALSACEEVNDEDRPCPAHPCYALAGSVDGGESMAAHWPPHLHRENFQYNQTVIPDGNNGFFITWDIPVTEKKT